MSKKMVRGLLLAIGVAATSTGALAACNVPFDSKAPYEAVVDAYIGGTLQGTYRRQVYRGDGLTKTEVETFGPGMFYLTKSQANFTVQLQNAKGTFAYRYHNPTDRYLSDQMLAETEVEIAGPKGTKLVRSRVQYFPDEIFEIGGCRLRVRHYKVIGTDSGEMTESWFSPDIQTSLKRVSAKSGQSPGSVLTAKVKQLSTENVPKPP